MSLLTRDNYKNIHFKHGMDALKVILIVIVTLRNKVFATNSSILILQVANIIGIIQFA